jgi:hypothetical protein
MRADINPYAIADRTITLVTKNTDYYAGGSIGTVYIALGTLSSVGRFPRHTLDRDLYMCFRALSAFNAADQITPFLVDDTVAAMNSTLAKVWIGQSSVLGVVWPIGQIWSYRAPEQVRRYMNLGATALSSGTYTGTTVEAYWEHGARAGNAVTLGGTNL